MELLEVGSVTNVKVVVFRYTVSHKSDVKPVSAKRKALALYLEGLGFRAIGRILNISYGTVYQWVKAYGSQVSLPESQDQVEIVEMDEIHTYVGSKKLLLDMDSC